MERKKYFFLLITSAILLLVISRCEEDRTISNGEVMDIDGNTYKTVIIGTQTWMAENLKATKFRDGSEISMYYFYSDGSANENTYGAFYPFAVVNSGKLCPIGWHIPNDSEWSILSNYLGGVDIAGGKLKEAGLMHWYNPNTGGTNESGFTALPGGSYDRVPIWFGMSTGWHYDTLFLCQTTLGFWWSLRDENLLLDPNYIRLQYDNTLLTQGSVSTYRCLSVRCIKD